jgi:COP9 signalosome complex subunit 7
VHITSIAPLRDLRPNSLPDILKVLQVWESRCSSVVGEIEAQIAGVRTNAAKRKARDMKRQEVVENAVLSAEVSGENTGNGGGGGSGVRTTTRSAGVRAGPVDENRKGKGIGVKRDLDEQQEDEETARWGQQGGGEEDGGVGVGLARMEVDEGPGSAGKTGDGGRTAKRAVGKKGL